MKGTTSRWDAVLLTPNEVEHARSFPNVALFLLAEITVIRDAEAAAIEATGGRATIYEPWKIDEGSLHPVGYEYAVPTTGSTS